MGGVIKGLITARPGSGEIFLDAQEGVRNRLLFSEEEEEFSLFSSAVEFKSDNVLAYLDVVLL